MDDIGTTPVAAHVAVAAHRRSHHRVDVLLGGRHHHHHVAAAAAAAVAIVDIQVVVGECVRRRHAVMYRH